MEAADLKAKPSLTLKRSYPAAPERVWRAWTDPQALAQWFKPDPSWTVPVAEADVRVGGRYRIVMKDAGGQEFDLSGTYREVAPQRRLVMTWGWSNQPGHESLVTATFRAAGAGTALELRHERYIDMENEATHEEGWTGALDQLGGVLHPGLALTIERHFPVAPEKVWRAWTDPEAVKRWFGPGGPQPVSVAELDVRVGGRYRICFGGADGNEHEVRGVYREVVPNRRLVFTWTWPRTTPERESVVTIEFRAAGGGTDLAFLHEKHFNATVRDNHLRGWSGTFVKLEQYLKGEAKS